MSHSRPHSDSGTLAAEPPAATFDVIVVGGGGSGLAAGCSAAEHGASVLVLERQRQPGGTTGIAVGSFTAAATRWQQAAGITDSAADHCQDVTGFAPPELEARNNTQLRAFFLEHSAETLQWLAGMGLSFLGPHPEPPNRVPRMHNVTPGAKAYIAALQLRLQSLGGRLRCHSPVVELLRAPNQAAAAANQPARVTGVVVQAGDDGRRVRYLARRGVILAAGDYAGNAQLIGKYKGPQFTQVEGINPFAGGDGHLLAERAGAELLNMDITYGPELRFVPSSRRPFQQWLPVEGPAARWIGWVARRLPPAAIRWFVKRLLVTWQHPEDSLLREGAALVNDRGRRFADERSAECILEVARQPGKRAYLLLDQWLTQRYSAWPRFVSTAPDIAYAYVDDYLRLRPDVACRGTLEEVAARRGLPADALRATVDALNRQREAAAGASGPETPGLNQSVSGTDAGELSPRPFDRGPYVLLGPVKAYFTTTEGGAKINPRMQVLTPEDLPIPGLYAAGQNGLGGMVLWGHGLHIAWALTSGRLAGRAAAMAESPNSA